MMKRLWQRHLLSRPILILELPVGNVLLMLSEAVGKQTLAVCVHEVNLRS